MTYRLLADALVLAHFAFLVFAVFGGLLVLRWPKAAWLHLPVVAWAAFVEIYRHSCPLTRWENWLRQRSGLETYSGGFMDHYILPVIYPPGLTPGVQLFLGILLVACYTAVYAFAWTRHRRRKVKVPA